MNFLKLNDGHMYINPESITKVEKGDGSLVVWLTSGGYSTISNPDDINAVLAVVNPKPKAPEPMYFDEKAVKSPKKAGK
jgi:hypothetical protein